MILTKKYRLIWSPETMEVIGFPEEEHTGSETIVGFGMESFESDEFSEIISKLEEIKK